MHPCFQGSTIKIARYRVHQNVQQQEHEDRVVLLYTRLLLRLWGWNKDQQLVGRRETSPEGRGFPKVCGPQCPDGLHPQWGHGQGLSPFDEDIAALGSEVSRWCLKL